jgi:hypothetical protein
VLSRESSATLQGVLGEMSSDLTHNGILANSENGTASTGALEYRDVGNKNVS